MAPMTADTGTPGRWRIRLACGHWTPVVTGPVEESIVARGWRHCEKCPSDRVGTVGEPRALKDTAKLPSSAARNRGVKAREYAGAKSIRAEAVTIRESWDDRAKNVAGRVHVVGPAHGQADPK